MAKGLNRAQLLGNVGRDPEVKATSGGTIVASFSMATPDRVKVNGNWQEQSEWHNIVCFGRTAEIVRDYVHKGSKLLLEGKIQTRSWDDKQTGTKKYRTEIIAWDLTLLDGRRDGAQQQRSSDDDRYYGNDGAGSYESGGISDDDIPF